MQVVRGLGAIRKNLVASRTCRRYFAEKECLVPAPSWSLKDLQLSTKNTKLIVTGADVENLCKLACINLDQSQTSIQSVVDDINLILRCAASIKKEGNTTSANYEERLFTETKLTMSSLRDDVADNTSYKEMLLTKAIGRKGDFYSVPNVNSKRHDQSSNDTID